MPLLVVLLAPAAASLASGAGAIRISGGLRHTPVHRSPRSAAKRHRGVIAHFVDAWSLALPLVLVLIRQSTFLAVM